MVRDALVFRRLVAGGVGERMQGENSLTTIASCRRPRNDRRECGRFGALQSKFPSPMSYCRGSPVPLELRNILQLLEGTCGHS
jgi:hypothetical protein